MRARWLIFGLGLVACGDDGGGPCLTPLAVDDRLRLGNDCRVFAFGDFGRACASGGAFGRDAQVAVRADGVELRAWTEYVEESPGTYVDRVVGDLIGTGRCEPRRELARAEYISSFSIVIGEDGFDVDLDGSSGGYGPVSTPDGSIATTEAIGDSLCGGSLHGVRFTGIDGSERSARPIVAGGFPRLASAPDGLRVATTVFVLQPGSVSGAIGCESPVFITLNANGNVVSAETPVAVPPF